MQFNILCVLALLVAFVASAAVPEVAPDVTSTYETWFDVEDFDVTDFKFATRDEGLCLSVSVDMASLIKTSKKLNPSSEHRRVQFWVGQ
ncbi:hypothetical protein AAWM_01569 [Aspergillus awamori]|uniref:Uncharacterized protein n=1 Tax=Aspergillus awamori TaxID=105351 RepID=A0A401KH38_ASPAW|nr:hypothetical protein AAWM_01569 [Aspergillus awamori]